MNKEMEKYAWPLVNMWHTETIAVLCNEHKNNLFNEFYIYYGSE